MLSRDVSCAYRCFVGERGSFVLRWKRVLKIISLLVAITIVIGLAQHYVMRRMDAHQRRMNGFYMEEKDSLDMVILGSSEIYNDFIPAKAYEKYGVTSYLYGFQANPVSLWTYQLEEIERTQNPDILVIECNGAGYDKEELDDPAEVRFMTDDMPLSGNKIKLIREKGTEEKLSYYFPIIKYHSHMVPDGDLLNVLLLEKRGFHILRGGQACMLGEDFGTDVMDVQNDNSVAELDPDGEKHLRAFLERCKASDIKNIVFVRFPHVVTDGNYLRFQRYHRIEQIVEEYGFDYIDFDDYKAEMDVDENEDFLDCEHMNLYGAEKMTDFFVPYIMEKYHVNPRGQSEKATRQWEQTVSYYHQLYDYWSYIQSLGPERIAAEKDLNDNYGSLKRIEAYYEQKE